MSMEVDFQFIIIVLHASGRRIEHFVQEKPFLCQFVSEHTFHFFNVWNELIAPNEERLIFIPDNKESA